MAPGKRVQLVPHDSRWAERARDEGDRLAAALGPALLTVHHIGSTAIPGIVAKPIIDLLPVVASIEAFDECRAAIEALGYVWRGEHGLSGRRYCVKNDPETDQRQVQIHFYEDGSPEITRYLAFRDYLLSNPSSAAAYAEEKRRCQALHPHDGQAYQDCKGEWIRRVEAEAMRSVTGARQPPYLE